MTESVTVLLAPLEAWYDPIVAVGSWLLQLLCWVVSGLLLLFQSRLTSLPGLDSGWVWLLSIVGVTLLFRVLMIPISLRQAAMNQRIQRILPQVRELQATYWDDQVKLNFELLRLYRAVGYSVRWAYLPLLLHAPLFFGLLVVFRGAAEGVPWGQWLQDRPDVLASLQEARILDGRIVDTVASLGWDARVTSLHVLCGLLIAAGITVTAVQSKLAWRSSQSLTGESVTTQQRTTLVLSALLIGIGGLIFPVGVLIYGLTSKLWALGFQVYVSRRSTVRYWA